MKEESTKRARTKTLGRALVALVVLLLVGVFASNLFIKRQVEEVLKKRTRLEWSVAGASWSPWGGVQLRGLLAEIPPQPGQDLAPVLKVSQVNVSPYWTTLFQKRPKFREVVIEKPEGNLPIELISLLVAEKGQVDAAVGAAPVLPKDQDPALPQKKKKPTKKEAPGSAKSGETGAQKKSKKKPKDAKAQDPKKKKSPPKLEKVEVKPVKKLFPSRVIVRDGSFRIYVMASKEKDVRVKGLSLDFPIAGPEAEGAMSLQSVELAGQRMIGALTQKTQWKEPVLSFPAQELEWQGLKFLYGGQLQLKGNAYYSLALQGLPGAMVPYESASWTGLQLAVEEVKTLMVRSEGHLRRPGTWRADMLVDVRGVNASQRDRHVGHRFDLGQFVGIFRQGVFQIADMRLRSERLSVMGNGLMLSDGQMWSVLRVVADPEISAMISRIALGSHISQGWTRSWLRPMGTPDRRYRDLHIKGKVPQVLVDVGRKNEQLELNQIIRMMRQFFRGEAAEEIMMEASERKEEASR